MQNNPNLRLSVQMPLSKNCYVDFISWHNGEIIIGRNSDLSVWPISNYVMSIEVELKKVKVLWRSKRYGKWKEDICEIDPDTPENLKHKRCKEYLISREKIDYIELQFR